jgi:hypothetical protein
MGFQRREPRPSHKPLQLWGSDDDGDTWNLISTTPSVPKSAGNTVSATFGTDPCRMLVYWNGRSAYGAADSETYLAAYNVCGDAWSTPITVTATGNMFNPLISTYNRAGHSNLPIIVYQNSSNSFLNLWTSPYTWLGGIGSPSLPYLTTEYDFVQSGSIQYSNAKLFMFGRQRSTEGAGPCGFHNNLYLRIYKEDHLDNPSSSMFIHPRVSNHTSMAKDRTGAIWACNIAEEDTTCAQNKALYAWRIDPVTEEIDEYLVSSIGVGNPQGSTWLSGDSKNNYGITIVRDTPTIVFTSKTEDFRTIWSSKFNGVDWDPPVPRYHDSNKRWAWLQVADNNNDRLIVAGRARPTTGLVESHVYIFREAGEDNGHGGSKSIDQTASHWTTHQWRMYNITGILVATGQIGEMPPASAGELRIIQYLDQNGVPTGQAEKYFINR